MIRLQTDIQNNILRTDIIIFFSFRRLLETILALQKTQTSLQYDSFPGQVMYVAVRISTEQKVKNGYL